MKLNDVFAVLQGVAPVSVSDEMASSLGFKDNSGIIIDCGKEVTRALFALDFSPRTVTEAEAARADLIVTHHPAIFAGIRRIHTVGDSPSSSIARCLKGGISVISMHLNFDAAPRGIDYFLMRGLGGKSEQAVLDSPTGGAYGRVYSVEGQSFDKFAAHVKKEFCTQRCRFYNSGKDVKKVASFCGAGVDERAIAFSIANGADTFVSADIKHHHICALTEAGLNVVEMTHYASEIYGFARIYAEIKDSLGVPSSIFTDGSLL